MSYHILLICKKKKMKFTDIEQLAIRRVLTFVKHRCKSIDDTALISSPIIGDIMKKLYLEMNPEFNFFLEEDSIIYDEVVESAICNLKIFYEWETFNDKLKHLIIIDIFYPFEVNESTIIRLIKKANFIHGLGVDSK